jgi:hypothetical protein
LVEKEKLVDIEKLKERVKKFGEKGYRYLLDTNQLTEKDFEEYCKIKPEISKIYFRFNKCPCRNNEDVWISKELLRH